MYRGRCGRRERDERQDHPPTVRTELDPVDYRLEQISSSESQTSKSEILRKALTLLDVAREGKRAGKKLALVGDGGGVTTEIVGCEQ